MNRSRHVVASVRVARGGVAEREDEERDWERGVLCGWSGVWKAVQRGRRRVRSVMYRNRREDDNLGKFFRRRQWVKSRSVNE